MRKVARNTTPKGQRRGQGAALDGCVLEEVKIHALGGSRADLLVLFEHARGILSQPENRQYAQRHDAREVVNLLLDTHLQDQTAERLEGIVENAATAGVERGKDITRAADDRRAAIVERAREDRRQHPYHLHRNNKQHLVTRLAQDSALSPLTIARYLRVAGIK